MTEMNLKSSSNFDCETKMGNLVNSGYVTILDQVERETFSGGKKIRGMHAKLISVHGVKVGQHVNINTENWDREMICLFCDTFIEYLKNQKEGKYGVYPRWNNIRDYDCSPAQLQLEVAHDRGSKKNQKMTYVKASYQQGKHDLMCQQVIAFLDNYLETNVTEKLETMKTYSSLFEKDTLKNFKKYEEKYGNKTRVINDCYVTPKMLETVLRQMTKLDIDDCIRMANYYIAQKELDGLAWTYEDYIAIKNKDCDNQVKRMLNMVGL